MTTRAQLLTDLNNRLQDSTNAVWSASEKNEYLNHGIEALYPTWFINNTDTTIAGAGPLQTMPAGASDIYYVGLQTATSNRVRVIRGWHEGSGQAVIPKIGITGSTLVWAWTSSYSKPAAGGDTLVLPKELEDIVVLRAQITALERVLSDRTKATKYYAVNVREGVSEQDVGLSLDALHASINARQKDAIKRPERVG